MLNPKVDLTIAGIVWCTNIYSLRKILKQDYDNTIVFVLLQYFPAYLQINLKAFQISQSFTDNLILKENTKDTSTRDNLNV